MAGNKTRQALTQSQMLSIVECTEAELLTADSELAKTADKFLDGIFSAGTFDKLVKAGVYQASTIMEGDRPAFVIIHTRNALGWLVVEGAVRIGKSPIRILFEGSFALARHLQAEQVVFVTKLKALFEYATERDWRSLGVILCKPVPQ